MRLQLVQRDPGFSVIFLDHYGNNLTMACRNVFPDVVRTDGQFAMTAVNQNGKLNGLGTAVMKYGFDRSTDCTACLDHVVDQNYLFT